MTTLTLTHSAIQKKISSFEMPGVNWKIVCFAALVFAFCLLMFYALQIIELTRGTYLIQSYQKELNSLTSQSRILEVGFAESGFLGSIEQKTREMNFIKTTKVKYIQVADSILAKAK